MQHIDEHSLELYVLNSDAVQSRRYEIQEHLTQCAGCRSLVEQMTASYRSVEEQFKKLEASASSSSQALERLRTKSVEFAQPKSPAVSYRPVTRFQNMQYFVRQHPVVVGSGSFLALAGLALLGNLAFKTPSLRDQNPVTSHNNPQSQEVEILNKSRQILWTLPTRGLAAEVRNWDTQTVVTSLNGDGINEVLTSMWLPGDPAIGKNQPFRVFSSEKELLHEFHFTAPISYAQRNYPYSWTPSNIVAGNISSIERKDILITWRCERSPSVITRLDADAKELGQYWHMGAPMAMSLVDLGRDGKQELVLMGRNDTEDSSGNEFPAIVVLDPSRIVGAKKSVAAQAFHLPLSDAELYYVKLPTSSMSKALLKTDGVFRLFNLSDSLLTFTTSSDFEETESRVSFEYTFSRDMKVVQVKSDDAGPAVYEKLVKQGKLTGKLDQKYLDDLKKGVRYWDGTEWVKEAVKIRHGQELSMVNGQLPVDN